MKLTLVKIQDLKCFEELEVQLGTYGLLLRGGNEKGKSSIIQIIEALVGGTAKDIPKAIREGAEKGQATGIIIDRNGGEWNVELEVKKNRKGQEVSTIKLITPDGAKFNTISEVKKVLGGMAKFDPIEFASNATTKAGQAKNAKMLGDLAGVDVELYMAAIADQDAKRKEASAMVREIENVFEGAGLKPDEIKENPNPPADPAELRDKLNEAENFHSNRERLAQEMEEIKESVSYDSRQAQVLANQVDQAAKDLIAKKERRLEEIMDEMASLEDEIGSLKQGKYPSESFPALLAAQRESLLAGMEKSKAAYKEKEAKLSSMEEAPDVEALREAYDKAVTAKERYARQLALLGKAEAYKKAKADEAAAIEVREAKRKELQSKISTEIASTLPEGYDLDVDEGGVMNFTYQGLPINENQVPTSKMMDLAMTMAMRLVANNQLRLVAMQRGESWDGESTRRIIEKAKELDVCLLLEKVVEDGTLEIETIE